MAKFYRCEICGNIVAVIEDGGVNPECCGTPMTELKPNTVDAAVEKHVPVVTSEQDGHVLKVAVGEVEHPMGADHYIEWIACESGKRLAFLKLEPGDKPESLFPGELMKSGTAYAYCNLHGLWKADF